MKIVGKINLLFSFGFEFPNGFSCQFFEFVNCSVSAVQVQKIPVNTNIRPDFTTGFEPPLFFPRFNIDGM
jgi:hypothetical protein